MIKHVKLENFGPIRSIDARDFAPINLIIGSNGSGKTILLKALYAMVRSQEEWARGDDPRTFPEVLSDKLYWTFQADKLGDLVRKGPGNRLKASITMHDNSGLAYEFGVDTSRKVTPLHNNLPHRSANSIFLPPKEVLSLAKVILKSGLQDKVFGFDATYTDLVLALQNLPQRGRNYDAFNRSRRSLEQLFEGRMEYDEKTEQWVYRRGNSRFSVHTTAEGIKKIAILDTLLGNRFLSPDSIVFIDEPEAALHPRAISQLLDIIQLLSEQGIQFFLATHSYYVIKKLFILAIEHTAHVPILVNDTETEWQQFDLLQGLPENEIIKESIRLYDQELEATLK